MLLAAHRATRINLSLGCWMSADADIARRRWYRTKLGMTGRIASNLARWVSKRSVCNAREALLTESYHGQRWLSNMPSGTPLKKSMYEVRAMGDCTSGSGGPIMLHYNEEEGVWLRRVCEVGCIRTQLDTWSNRTFRVLLREAAGPIGIDNRGSAFL